MAPPADEPLQNEVNADRQFIQAQNQRADLALQVDKLSLDMHAVKGNLAANTSITLATAATADATAATVEAIKIILGKIDIDKIAAMVSVVEDMKGGVKVLEASSLFIRFEAPGFQPQYLRRS